MNTAEPVRIAVSIALAVALAFVGLHAALTASNWFAAYVVLPIFRGQDSLRSYMLFGGHAAYIATSIVIGLVLSLAVGSQVWAGTIAFLGAVIFFVIDWEQRDGSHFSALLDLPVVVFVVSSLVAAALARRLRRPHAA